ncbi:MAG: cytochrome c oxidase subunit 3, partial [Planctomycetota bacterium]
WPRDLPSVPGSLILSTLLLAVTSVAIERAARDARRAAGGTPEDPQVAAAADRARRDLLVAALLGVAFLLLQGLSWIDWLRQVNDRLSDSSDHRFALTGFWVLTGLHAIHVLGGALPLGLEVWLSRRRPTIDHHRAGTIRFTAMYWHFLGAIWIALYAALLATI